jgi:hypothetical protein
MCSHVRNFRGQRHGFREGGNQERRCHNHTNPLERPSDSVGFSGISRNMNCLKIPGAIPRDADSEGAKWDLLNLICHQLAGGAAIAGPLATWRSSTPCGTKPRIQECSRWRQQHGRANASECREQGLSMAAEEKVSHTCKDMARGTQDFLYLTLGN